MLSKLMTARDLLHRWLTIHARLSVSAVALLVFAILWIGLRLGRRGKKYVFFDPQDFARVNSRRLVDRRVLPLSAETATFEPMLKHYLGVVQLLVTVAAASIAFGSNGGTGQANAPPIWLGVAKLSLAYSIFFGVLFCALLLWRYDEYAQDMESYTPFWHSTVSALGFSCLIGFFLGYVTWGFGLFS